MTELLQHKDSPLAVCIISHQAYGALSGSLSGQIGGIEWQTALMAKWLAAHGHPVTMITWNEGGPPHETIDGVRVIKLCRERDGLPGLRFFHPKWTSLIAALRAASADVYYQNGGECVTGQAAFWCRRNHKPFVFCAASDADCNPRFPELKSWRERLLFRYGLRRANAIAVQTLVQQKGMLDLFGLDSTVIPMPCHGPVDEEYSPPRFESRRVLWVGRVARVKRPDRLLDLAQRCPDIQFDLVGPVYDAEYSQSIRRRASGICNVTLHGAASRNRVFEFYRQSTLLCCTSDYEGFPNTFLEAWSHGLPIVSTVNPDGLLTRRDLGRVGETVDELRAAILGLLDSQSVYAAVSSNARRYYQETHTVGAILPRFVALFEAVVGGKPIQPSASFARKRLTEA